MALPPKILYITVPQVGHLPLIALRPFFVVTSIASVISFFALHLTQYPSAIEKFARSALHAPTVSGKYTRGRFGEASTWKGGTEVRKAVKLIRNMFIIRNLHIVQSKLQTPSTKHQRSSKLQAPKRECWLSCAAVRFAFFLTCGLQPTIFAGREHFQTPLLCAHRASAVWFFGSFNLFNLFNSLPHFTHLTFVRSAAPRLRTAIVQHANMVARPAIRAILDAVRSVAQPG